MANKHYLQRASPIRFVVLFITLFLIFNYANKFFFSITTPGKYYSAFLAHNLNYIDWLRWVLLHTSAAVLNWMGFTTIVSKYELLVAGHNILRLVYTCLGLGVMSFIAAFAIAYPKPVKSKLIYFFTAIFCLQVLNIVRLVLLALYWDNRKNRVIDHHLIFDVIIYIIIAISIYYWVNKNAKETHATN